MVKGRFFLFLSFALSVLFFTGCGHTPVTRTVFDAIPSFNKTVDRFSTNPNLRYLRVTVKNQSIFMVLGYTEKNSVGDIEVWYSSTGEVIRLQNGRIIGTIGLETDWLNVIHLSLPSWNSLANNPKALYQRQRDQMPGYRFGIVESVSIYPTPPPTNSKIVNTLANQFRWYEEVTLNTDNKLPSARYAVQNRDGELRIAYGEQCLTENFCLSWQLWPVTK
jgi:hypothetical protein